MGYDPFDIQMNIGEMLTPIKLIHSGKLVAFCQLPKLLPLSTHLPLSSHRINSHRKSGVPLVPFATIHPVGQVARLNAIIAPAGIELPAEAVVCTVPSGNLNPPYID